MMSLPWFILKNTVLFCVRLLSRLIIYVSSLKGGEPLALFASAPIEEESDDYLEDASISL